MFEQAIRLCTKLLGVATQSAGPGVMRLLNRSLKTKSLRDMTFFNR